MENSPLSFDEYIDCDESNLPSFMLKPKEYEFLDSSKEDEDKEDKNNLNNYEIAHINQNQITTTDNTNTINETNIELNEDNLNKNTNETEFILYEKREKNYNEISKEKRENIGRTNRGTWISITRLDNVAKRIKCFGYKIIITKFRKVGVRIKKLPYIITSENAIKLNSKLLNETIEELLLYNPENKEIIETLKKSENDDIKSFLKIQYGKFLDDNFDTIINTVTYKNGKKLIDLFKENEKLNNAFKNGITGYYSNRKSRKLCQKEERDKMFFSSKKKHL